MLEEQLRARKLYDERVLEAMARVPRELFVPESIRGRAYDDAALPIGCDQTISQPAMVAYICALLDLRGDERVLDVGTGSGYQAAVLAELAAEVHTIERVAGACGTGARKPRGGRVCDTCRRARRRRDARRSGARAVRRDRRGRRGARRPPRALYEQLEPNGRLVVPIGNRRDQLLTLVVRGPAGPELRRSVPCRFVPLIGEQGFPAGRW